MFGQKLPGYRLKSHICTCAVKKKNTLDIDGHKNISKVLFCLNGLKIKMALVAWRNITTN